MKRKTAFALIIAVIFIFTTTACQDLAFNKDLLGQEIGKLMTKNDVADNLFTSSAVPQTAYRISTDFQYLGKTDTIKTVAVRKNDQSSLEKESHLFVFPKGGSAVEKGVIIRIYSVAGDPNFWPEITMGGKAPCLQSGSIEIYEDEYDYCTALEQNVLLDYEKDLMREKGLTSPGCSLTKHMVQGSGFGNKSHIQITYFEGCNSAENKIFAGSSFKAPKSTLTGEEQAVFDEFLKRSNKNIQILEKQKATAPLIYETTPPAAAPETGKASGTIEEKLQLLKNLHEKGLITNEEYERKKADLLDKI